MSSAAQALRELKADRSERAFAPKSPALLPAQAQVEAARCLYCVDAPCTKACPADIDVASFIRRITTGDITGSAKKILSQNVLGASCGVVCPVEELCEGACVLNHLGESPVRIGMLQHFAVQTTVAERGFPLMPRKATREKRVAVIGAGPGGIAAATELRILGHEPVVFEARHYPGGLNTYGVAPYKLTAEEALYEVGYLEALGIDVRLGIRIGVEVKGADLLQEFDAVVIACGLGTDRILPIPGSALPGSMGATAFVEWVKLGKVDLNGTDTAVVLGAGNTALDCVQELKLLGVRHVMLAMRRGEHDIAGYAHEWAAAKALGVQLLEHVEPAKLSGNGRVETLALKTKDNDALVVDCQLVIWAIGQDKRYSVVSEFAGVQVQDGCIVTNQDMRTGCAKVWACGDATNGGKEVVNAAAEAKRAALAIDRA